jgi:2-iminobutanoate/2-iminopropanoate deaminase
MKRDVVTAQDAPKAIGPYSQAIRCEGREWMFLSGQIPLDPASMQVVSDDVQSQAEQVIRNIKAVLASAEMDLRNVVKTTMFLKDMNDFAKVNEIYATHFSENPPARSTIEVARLPKDVKVEIECIAMR